MFRKRIHFFSSILMLLFFSIFSFNKTLALDIDNERPTLLRGIPSAEWIDISNPDAGRRYSHSDPEYTITIRNTTPETLPDMQFLVDCALNSATTLANCFYFNGPTTNAKLLNSKTYVNNKLKSAVAILRYGGVNVVGDSYSASGDFNYWGRHLRQATDNSDSNAFWESGNYSFNPNAQSYWDTGDPNKNSEMTDTINRLSRNTKSPVNSIFSDGPSYVWIPRSFHGVCGQLLTCSEDNLYPEGRIWHPERDKDLYIRAPKVEYSDKAAILLSGRNLNIETSVEPKYGQNDAALGFIVQNGNVIIRNNTSNTMTVRASIFVPNGNIIIIGNRINLIGSFVAKDFVIESNIASFIQDTRGETSWPPGFRELKLPIVSSN